MYSFNKYIRLFILITIIICFSKNILAERPKLKFEGAYFMAYPIAIAPLKNTKGTDPRDDSISLDIVKTLTNDLKISGLFNVLKPESFLANLKKEGLTAGTINFQDWLNIGASSLIKGGFQIEGSELMLKIKLFEVASGKEVINKTYTGTVAELRKLLHEFADEIFKYFTNEKGIFSTKIATIRKLSGTQELWLMDFDGRNLVRVTNNGSINILPAWSPDGTSIAYTSFLQGNPDLYDYKLLSGKSKKISAYNGLNIGASFSRDNKKIAITISKDGNSEIYLIDRKGSILKRLTNHWGIDSSPTWSPDDKKIAFVSERAGNPHIYIMDSNGENKKRLTFKGTYNQTPEWSPLGDYIVFTARDERNVFDIFKINPNDPNDIIRLTQDEGNNEEPSWSPNGRYIVFASTRLGQSKLFIMTANGQNQTSICNKPGEFVSPVWSPWFIKK